MCAVHVFYIAGVLGTICPIFLKFQKIWNIIFMSCEHLGEDLQRVHSNSKRKHFM